MTGWKVTGILLIGFVLGGIAVILAMSAGLFDARPGTKKDWNGANHKTEPGPWGNFPQEPKVTLLKDGRDLRLDESFAYIDPNKRVWTAPKDSVVNGASIPQVFWSVAGGPLEGQYRNASIIHDVACDRMTDPWQDVHLMFYEGCRCGGVPEKQAKILYAAVYFFGPRWELTKEPQVVKRPDAKGKFYTATVEKHVGRRALAPIATEADRKHIEEFVNKNNPSLEELRKLYPKKG
jgi:hypothetical protein